MQCPDLVWNAAARAHGRTIELAHRHRPHQRIGNEDAVSRRKLVRPKATLLDREGSNQSPPRRAGQDCALQRRRKETAIPDPEQIGAVGTGELVRRVEQERHVSAGLHRLVPGHHIVDIAQRLVPRRKTAARTPDGTGSETERSRRRHQRCGGDQAGWFGGLRSGQTARTGARTEGQAYCGMLQSGPVNQFIDHRPQRDAVEGAVKVQRLATRAQSLCMRGQPQDASIAIPQGLEQAVAEQ